jgi:hypothetical protein
MVLLGPNERGSMFSVGQSSSFFANCSYLRGINFFEEREGEGVEGEIGKGGDWERGRLGKGEIEKNLHA